MPAPTTPPPSDSFRLLCLALCAVAALFLTLTLLPGCGGQLGTLTDALPGASSSPSPTSTDTASAPPLIEVSASLSTVKRLTLNWTSQGMALAQRALILQDVDGDGPLPAEPLADVPAADGTATVEIFLPIALHASYRVALCDGGRCAQSDPLRLQGSLVQAMGRFKADAPLRDAEFGVSLALSRDGEVLALSADGRTLAVGAPWDDGPGDSRMDDGAVYVFTESNGNWTQTHLLRDSSNAPEEWFGAALALNTDGTVLAVGSAYNDASGLGVHAAPIDDANAPGTGAVYLYTRLLGTWSLSAFVKSPMDLGNGAFGSAVALDGRGNTLVVGAREADINLNGVVEKPSHSNSGSAHVFVRTEGGPWAPHGAPLRGPVPHRADEFGRALALSADGQTVVIGTQYNAHSGLGVATTESPTLASDAGSAYVFRRQADGWGSATVLQPSDHSTTGARGVRLGSEVAISGNGRTVAVGARSHGGPGAGVSSDPGGSYGDDPLFVLSGAVFLY